MKPITTHPFVPGEGVGLIPLCRQRDIATGLECLKPESAHAPEPKAETPQRDACEFCRGTKAGVPGNEVVVGGVVMCDYCHALYLRAHEPRNENEYDATRDSDSVLADIWRTK